MMVGLGAQTRSMKVAGDPSASAKKGIPSTSSFISIFGPMYIINSGPLELGINSKFFGGKWA